LAATVTLAGASALTSAPAQATPNAAKGMRERFALTNTIIMLVDHQIGTVNWVKSQPKDQVIGATRALARMAVDYQMPLVLTTTMEEMVGTTIEDLQKIAPDAYAKRFKRSGQLSCWDDPARSGPGCLNNLPPSFKWTPGGLPKVQSCPRRRRSLLDNRPTRWATRGAPTISF
jgi:hypothetical protein